MSKNSFAATAGGDGPPGAKTKELITDLGRSAIIKDGVGRKVYLQLIIYSF